MKHQSQSLNSRRGFLQNLALGLGAAALYSPAWLAGTTQAWAKSSEAGGFYLPQNRKLGIALVGLGSYSTNQLAPALQSTRYCKLAGAVTGTPAKADRWEKQYNLPRKNIYSYDTFDRIADNPDIDIIYIVLPNGMHAEYTIRAFEAGKHVICEKPMAVSVLECQQMLAARDKANKMLSIGYRLHFEPYNQEMMRLGQQQVFGPVNSIKTGNGFVINDANSWRLDKKLAGGGPLMDMGVYSVQGARYTTGLEPVAVTAREEKKTRPQMFNEVEETLHWTMEFPGGATAHCETSYAKRMSNLRAEAQKGWFELDPAYGYGGQKGKTSKGPLNFPDINQQAAQMDDFAQCILQNKPTRVPGEMGMQDVKIMEAIYRAARSGKREPV